MRYEQVFDRVSDVSEVERGEAASRAVTADERRPQAEGGQPVTISAAGAGRVAALRADLAARAAGIHAAEAELVGLIGEVARDGGWAGPGLRSVGHWGSIELGVAAHTVNDMAATAERLRSLPLLAAEFASGRLGFDKVRPVAAVATEATEADFVELAQQGTVEQLRRITNAFRRENPDSDDGPERSKAQRQARGLWCDSVLDRDGLVRIVAKLAPDDAALVMTAVRAHAEALWRDEHGKDEPTDTDDAICEGSQDLARRLHPTVPGVEGDDVDPQPFEPSAARRADALVALAGTGLEAGPTPTSGGEPAEVVVHVAAEFLAGHTETGRCHLDLGPAVSRDTARRLSCDCTITVMVAEALGRPLGVGRSTRTPPRWLRRALTHRDGGCAFPGCGHTRFVHAHHIRHWANGGPTNLDNLVLLCPKHHRAVHEGGYRVLLLPSGRAEFRRPNGQPILRPPQPATTGDMPRPLFDPDADPGARDGGRTDWSLTDTLVALATTQRASAPPC